MELNNIPTGTRRVGDIHSHIYSDGPSDNDINTAWSDPRGRPRYVVTKDGKIIEYNPKRMPNVLKDDERRIKEVGKCDTSERSVE